MGERFFNLVEKKQEGDVRVLGKIFIVGRKQIMTLGKEDSTAKCSQKAKDDGAIRKY